MPTNRKQRAVSAGLCRDVKRIWPMSRSSCQITRIDPSDATPQLPQSIRTGAGSRGTGGGALLRWDRRRMPLAQLANDLDVRLFSTGRSRHTARPMRRRLRRWRPALDRTLVLGGGGEWYVAWYCGFFHGLLEQDIDAAVARRDDRRHVGRLVHRLVDGDRPLPAPPRGVRFLRVFSRPLRPHGAGERPEHQPAARPEDQCRCRGRLDRDAADHRPRRTGRRQSGERLGTRAGRGIPDRRQQDRLAGGKDVYDGRRLLHGRTHRCLAGDRAQERHPAGAWCSGELFAAGRHGADAARSALLHGWRHVLQPGARRSRGRLEARLGHHAE